MRGRFVLLGSLMNLMTLLIGLILGFALGIQHTSVLAQTRQTVTPITPGVTTGTFGAGIVLAHEIQADKIVSNGYDLVKMHQNTLNFLLSRYPLEKTALQAIVDDSKSDVLYTIKTATPTPSQPEKKP
jgi:hypothetical protein